MNPGGDGDFILGVNLLYDVVEGGPSMLALTAIAIVLPSSSVWRGLGSPTVTPFLQTLRR